MASYVLTVITRGKGQTHFHAEYDSEEAAKTSQAELLSLLNDQVGGGAQFAQVGNATVRLADVESTLVTPANQAPGFGTGVFIA